MAELSQFALETLTDRYLQDGDTSVAQAFARASSAFASDIKHAERMYKYTYEKQWMTLATPTLSNAPQRKPETWGRFDTDAFEDRRVGLPISCFLNYVPDSREGLGDHYNENIWLASSGGGIGGYWGHVRSDGAKTSNGSQSTGSIPFIHVVDSQMLAFNQGKTRRGSYAAYMDISHPEIMEFLEIRSQQAETLTVNLLIFIMVLTFLIALWSVLKWHWMELIQTGNSLTPIVDAL